MSDKAKMRIAFREEGTMWNAYIAKPDTMEGAFLLGSIAMGVARSQPDIKAAFMEFMKVAFRQSLQDILGTEIPDEFDMQRAPEHERSGKA